MPVPTPPTHEVTEVCESLNGLWMRLGEGAADDPHFQALLRRLLMLEPSTETDRHMRMDIDMGLLPRPHALAPDGSPLFTVGQLARLFGLELGVLAREPGPASDNKST